VSGTGGVSGSGGSGGTGGVSGSGGSGGTGGVSGSGGSGGTGGVSGSGGSGGTGGGGGTFDGGVIEVVINEVRGQGGTDFVELYNAGSTAVDIAGYVVSDGGGGIPRLAEGVRFPVNTIVEPGGYVLVLAQEQSSGGPFTCFDFTPCFFAVFGISASGESVFFVDPGNGVVDTVDYPNENGAGGVVDGQTFGRLPDGTGAFQATATTPGLPNSPPL
jgi:hypothetical protein